MEENKEQDKPYEYYILLPIVMYFILGKANLKNYYSYLYDQFIEGNKILPDYIESISITKDVLTVRTDISAKIFSDIGKNNRISVNGDVVKILINEELAKEIKSIAFAEYTTELPLTVYGIFNFYANYIDIDSKIISIYKKGEFDKIKSMIEYIENKSKNTKYIYLLLRFPEYIIKDAQEDLGVDIKEKETLINYWKFKMNKLLEPLQKTIKI